VSEKKISTRQLIIFYAIFSFALKFLSVPKLLATTVGTDAWISAIISTVIELLVLFLALNILVMGKRSKIVLPFMLAMFFLQMVVIIGASHSLVTRHLFHEMRLQTFLIPLVLFGMAFAFVSARAIFRSGEIFYLLIIIGLALSIFPVIPRIQVSQMTPVGSSGFGSIVSSVFRNLIFFESASFLLIFSGDIKVSKDFRKKFMTIASVIGVVFVAFVFIAISVFGPLAMYKDNAIVDLAVRRMDMIVVCVWLILLMLRFGVTFHAAFVCIRYLFNIKKYPRIIGIFMAVALWAVWTFAGGNFINHLATHIIIAVLVFIIPILCLIGRRSKDEKHA